MADTTREVQTLEAGAPVRVPGRVKKVFPMADGTRRDKKPWYRQDIILEDSTGEVKVAWWNPPDIQTMDHLEGREVEVQGKVNIYQGKVSIKAPSTGVKAPDGGSLEGGNQKVPTPTQSRPGASGVPPKPEPMTDRQWMVWAGAISGEIRGLVEDMIPSEAVSSPHGAAAVVGAAERILVHLSMRQVEGSMRITYGQEPQPKEESTREREDPGDPDDPTYDVPF